MKKLFIAIMLLAVTSIPAYAQFWGGINNPPSRESIVSAITTTLIGTPVRAVFDGAGSELTSGKIIYQRIYFSGTITDWTILCDQNVGSTKAIIDIWKSTYALDTLPTVSNSITASSKPTVTVGSKTGSSSLLTGWTTTVGPGDVLSFTTDTVSTATWCSIDLRIKP